MTVLQFKLFSFKIHALDTILLTFQFVVPKNLTQFKGREGYSGLHFQRVQSMSGWCQKRNGIHFLNAIHSRTWQWKAAQHNSVKRQRGKEGGAETRIYLTRSLPQWPASSSQLLPCNSTFSCELISGILHDEKFGGHFGPIIAEISSSKSYVRGI